MSLVPKAEAPGARSEHTRDLHPRQAGLGRLPGYLLHLILFATLSYFGLEITFERSRLGLLGCAGLPWAVAES